jgi:hypothetical protein
MGIDLNNLFGQAKSAASQGMNDLLQTGGNSAIGYLEQQAVDVINQDQQQHVEAAQTAASQILSRPTVAGSFSAYLGNVMQNPTLKQYGTPIIIGIVVIAAAAVMLHRK